MADFSFPSIFSSRVSLVAARFPLEAETYASLVGAGIKLPETLARAAPKRQSEFLAGRYCAWRALVSAGADPDAAAKVGIAEDRSPVWPVGWLGAITHSDGVAAAAIARSSELSGLGLDVERVMSGTTASEVRTSILTAAELDFINQLNSLKGAWTAEEWVTWVFSAKESFYKCMRPRVGLFFGFHDAEISIVSDDQFKVTVLKNLNGVLPLGWTGLGRYARAEGRVFTSFEW